jgi:hypothetical protein
MCRWRSNCGLDLLIWDAVEGVPTIIGGRSPVALPPRAGILAAWGVPHWHSLVGRACSQVALPPRAVNLIFPLISYPAFDLSAHMDCAPDLRRMTSRSFWIDSLDFMCLP